ncbi:ribosomal peptide maturation radical SAM protein 1 [Nonomuraea solani]|uniref:Ribosomal peptide maturation radical SAM protein 1 n=1 Tax=Nonomuraea solani TaxID=1144553 RepID=A0A1H6EZE9_9ACTN|nr:RiPP maturation radical SAM C-methyltransferase [Nonomuraea solani]SEH03267.1 ribosomal peptide maturation radical SAM protein 1 [Nonomuraea solani]
MPPLTVIVSMPFMDARRPSIQAGLLAALARAQGFPVRTLHANLDFAARVGPETYDRLADHRDIMLGDWLFSLDAFGARAPDRDAALLKTVDDEEFRDLLTAIREREVPAYLDALMKALPWEEAAVVGFSCTFQQNAASFALARRLKARHPRLLTVFGGANFDGEMGLELVRSVECVDAAVIGEGDVAFPRLLAAVAEGTGLDEIPGLARRVRGEVVATPPAPLRRDMDALPPPDYDEYFEHAEELGLLARTSRREVWIPFEAARGCWWGERHHCTFCGLNGTSMAFRAKSPERLLAELAGQARRYRSFRFEAVDNILDMRYLEDLLPRLIASEADYDIFYEVKANLSRAHLRRLARAGVRYLQPGLESLSTNVLRLMRKGTTAAQNVNLLRWAQHYDIHVAWNILWGFPGESERDYAGQAALVPHLTHLRPPESAARIWLERFSPLAGGAFPLRFRRPDPSYAHVYPADVDLDKVAYFFEYAFLDALPDDAYAGLDRAVTAWAAAWSEGRPPELTYWSAPGFLQIHDGRNPDTEGTYTFHDHLAAIYLACSERPITAAAVAGRLGLPVEAVRAALEEFAGRGLVFLDGPRALALALPARHGR